MRGGSGTAERNGVLPEPIDDPGDPLCNISHVDTSSPIGSGVHEIGPTPTPMGAWRCSTGRASWPSTSPTAPCPGGGGVHRAGPRLREACPRENGGRLFAAAAVGGILPPRWTPSEVRARIGNRSLSATDRPAPIGARSAHRPAPPKRTTHVLQNRTVLFCRQQHCTAASRQDRYRLRAHGRGSGAMWRAPCSAPRRMVSVRAGARRKPPGPHWLEPPVPGGTR